MVQWRGRWGGALINNWINSIVSLVSIVIPLEIILTFIVEETEKEKAGLKEKEEEERIKRLKDREQEKRLTEHLWIQEEKRRCFTDKSWDANQIPVLENVSNSGGKEMEMGSDPNVSVSQLEETILKVQQQMAEGNDHIKYEMKAKGEQDKKEKEYECKRQ